MFSITYYLLFVYSSQEILTTHHSIMGFRLFQRELFNNQVIFLQGKFKISREWFVLKQNKTNSF